MTATLTSNPTRSIAELLKAPKVQAAFQFFEQKAEAITSEQIAICSIPAPPFQERERAEYLCSKFQELGFDVSLDKEGNCSGLRRGRSVDPVLVVSAHLDTVFPAGTDVTVRNAKGILFAPGIADDGCGLAALIALGRAMAAANIETEGSVLFVGTVGEEGEGNLRGVRYLFSEGQALGRAISRLVSYPVPREPRTTFNVGRIQGGTSINAIPGEAVMDVDLRSTSDHELRRLDAFFRRAMREAADDENAARRHGHPSLNLSVDLIGERPTGETPSDSSIVQIAFEATRALGVTPSLDQASTDANIPMSLRIPALTLGAGGMSGSSHTINEWYDPRDQAKGLKRGLLVALGLVGLK